MNKTIKCDRPAHVWEEALPIGNGGIGAMVYGGVDYETVQFNHDTLWSGCVNTGDEILGKYDFTKAREYILNGELAAGQKEAKIELAGKDSESYIPAGYLFIRTQETGGMFENYTRELSLEKAQVDVHYKRLRSYFETHCSTYHRRCFISHPHNLFVMKISSEKNDISFTASLACDMHADISMESNTIYLRSQAPVSMSHCDSPAPQDTDKKSVSYEMGARFLCDGGKCVTVNNTIRIEGAKEVVIFVAIDTSFIRFDTPPCKEVNCTAILDKAEQDGYDTIYSQHIQDYQQLFNRVDLNLFDDTYEHLSTEHRIQLLKDGGVDLGLTELLFHFGRYLLIASSREGSQPTTLFGIWSGVLYQRWFGGYTVNINTQMNYWPAEVCALPECHEPMLRMTKEISESGERTARNMFGCRGFCLNHNTDLWRITIPMPDHGPSSLWPVAGGWFVRHLWEHYLYNPDLAYLRDEVYPITKKAAEFFIDWLTEDRNGYLVTMPSTSPENSFYDKNGDIVGIGMATTMDMSIIKEVFSHIIEMSDILEIHDDFTNQVREMYPRLYPFNIATDGTLLEWSEEYKDVDEGHRHLSHLYGLYPAEIITEKDVELYNACEKSIRKRLNANGKITGWNSSWIVCLFARLKKGNDCQQMIEKMQRTLLYPTLLDSHPPFQIDGNFGIVAGITEMLLQSHGRKISILPAIGSSWKKGSFRGLRARGGYSVSANWSDNQIDFLEIKKGEEIVYKNNEKLPFGFTLTL